MAGDPTRRSRWAGRHQISVALAAAAALTVGVGVLSQASPGSNVGGSPRGPAIETPVASPVSLQDIGRRSHRPDPGEPCTRPVDVDSTGQTDVTDRLQAFIDASPDGSVICLAAGGTYRVEGGLHLAGRANLVLDGQGARMFATTRSAVPRLLIDTGGEGITVRDIEIEGHWPEAGTAAAVITEYEGNHGIAVGGTRDVEIGPGVVISNVGGDGVYLTAGDQAPVRWATDIRIHDSTIRGTGRMGVAITDGARDVTIEDNTFADIALHVFDIEPNGIVFPDGAAGAEDVRFVNNTIGRYGISPALESWLFAGTGDGPQTNIEVSRNLVRGAALRIGVWDFKGSSRSNIRVTDNWADTAAPGPTMVFEGVDGLIVVGNTQPLTSGELMRVERSRLVNPPG